MPYQPGIDKQYVSSIEFADTREMLHQVLDIQNEQTEDFMDIMDAKQAIVQTHQPTYHNHTNQPIFNPEEVVSSTPDGANPRRVQVVLSGKADSALRGTATLDQAGNFGVVFSRTEDPGGAIVVIDSVDANPLVFNAGDKISFFTSAFGEGSRGAESRRSTLDKHLNQVQVFKNAASQTDIQAVSKVEFEFNGQPYYFIKEQHEEWIRFRASIASGLFGSKMSDPNFTSAAPTLVDDEGRPIQTTRGIDQEIRENGQSYGPRAADIAFLSDFKRRASKLRSPKEYEMFQAVDASISWDTYWNALGNGAVFTPNARRVLDGKDLDLNFGKVSIFGMTFWTKQLECLVHDGIFGSYPRLANSVYLVPQGKIKNYMGEGMVERLRVRYMPVAGEMYKERLLGGLAPTPTDDRNVLRVHYDAIMGAEVLGTKDFAILETA